MAGPDSLRAWRPRLSLDAATIQAAHRTLAGERRGLRALLPFLGPAFVASVAYVDPGNFATTIQGGARFGYLLLWTVLGSNLMAMFIQALSAKLGIATGQNLAEVCRDQLPRPLVIVLWVLAELAAMATDVAEVLGGAIGFGLLFGLPLLPAGVLTGLVSFAILGLQRHGFRLLEAVITSLVGVIAACYVVETVLDTPAWGEAAAAGLLPRFEGPESVLLAVGILGATVMPHAIFLHSHLTQRRIPAAVEQQRRVFRFELLDIVVAMGIAGLVNAAMLVMAAATFHATGHSEVASIEVAHQTLAPLLGHASATIFAISLVAAGLSSATVGTLAGQVIMQGYLRRAVPLWCRRLVTIIPALVVIALGLEPTRTLVLSQVVLSFCLPAALVPLVLFTGRRDLMGTLVNRPHTTAAAGLLVGLIVGLNLVVLYQAFAG